MWRSVPQMPVLWTRMSTSLIPIEGSGTSSSQSPRSARRFTKAFISPERMLGAGAARKKADEAKRRATGPEHNPLQFLVVKGGEAARRRVVVVGGGFAGLRAALRLKKGPVDVSLIDRRNHHLFQPLLYQVATAVLNPSDIAAPIRRIVRGDNVTVLLGDVVAVDLANKKVRLEHGAVSYDFLIVATGATHSYFGHGEWAENAPGLKSIEDALEIRRRVLFAFEAAGREPDPELRKQWLTFVVVGGGPTGVELAGALAEIARKSLAHDFHHFDPTQPKIVLVGGQKRVLTSYPEDLSEKATRSLQKLGVDLRLGTIVTHAKG